MSLLDLIRGNRENHENGIAIAIPAIPATAGPEIAATIARIATIAVANSPSGKTDTTSRGDEMSLLDLIRGNRENHENGIAIAIPAIPAIQPQGGAATVARIATIAIANSPSGKTDTPTASLWRVTYPDRVITVACSEPETPATIEAAYPGASIEPTKAPPTDPVTLTQAQAETLQAWFTASCEGDAELIGVYMVKVRGSTDARDYFMELASPGDAVPDTRRHCRECAHMERGVCLAAKRGEVGGMTGECRPVDLIPRHCAEFKGRLLRDAGGETVQAAKHSSWRKVTI